MKKLIPILLLLPVVAHAATGQLDTQTIAASASSTTSEWSGMGLLQKVFGGIVMNPLNPSSSGNGASTILGEVFAVLNFSLLAIGTIWMMYTISSGVAQTAHEGELMGRRYSTLWTPVRMISGTVGIVPVFHGWSLSQLIMLWFSMLGVGIANMGWQSGVAYLDQGGTMIQSPALPGTGDLARSVFKASVCVEARNAAQNETNAMLAGDPVYKPVAPSFGGAWDSTGTVYSWGSNQGHQNNECGQVTVPPAQMPVSTKIASFFNGDLVPATSAAAAAGRDAFSKLAAAADQAAVNLVGSIVQSKIATMSTPGLPPAVPLQYDVTVIPGLQDVYTQALQSGMMNALGGHQGLQARMDNAVLADSQTQGFTSAGAWFMTLSAQSDGLSSAVAAVPKMTLQPGETHGGVEDIYAEAMRDVNAIDSYRVQPDSPLRGTDQLEVFLNKISNSVCPQGGTIRQNAQSWSLGQCLAEAMVSGDASGSQILQIKHFGDVLMGIGEIGATASWAARGEAEAVQEAKPGEAVPVVGGLIDSAKAIATGALTGIAKGESGWLGMASGAMVLFGAAMSLYLPMVPFIFWASGILVWLFVVVEAVVAAPLWAFAHMDAEGEGMGKRAEHGYLFILNVLFRPILMVIGFLMAVVLMNLMLGFVNFTFPKVIASVQVSSITGLVSIVILMFMSLMISLSMVQTCSNMILALPNQVLNWIGGQAASIGESLSSEAGSRLAMIGGHFGGGGGGGGGGMPGNPAQQVMKGVASATGSDWKTAGGGLAEMSGVQRARAEADFGKWSAGNPSAAQKHGLEGYVSFVQSKQRR